MNTIIHGCGCGVPPVSVFDLPGNAHKLPPNDVTGPIIDLHSHVLVPEVDALATKDAKWPAIAAAQKTAMGEASVSHNMQIYADIVPKMTDAQVRFADMDAMGITMQVLNPSPLQYHYWADEALADRMVRLQNDAIIAMCNDHPARFLGLCAVSLQHPELAARQLEEAMRHPAIKGVEISTMIGDRGIDGPELAPFWAAAERLGALVFIHPQGSTVGPRLQSHYLINLIGNPLETTVALSRLIFSGLLDRHPRLKILGAHGGGYFPAYAARSDHGWFVRPEARECIAPPSSYLSKLWFDTLVFDPAQLRRLGDQVGFDRLVLGTDYPYDMGAYSPWTLLADPFFSRDERQALMSSNACALLGI